MRMFLILAAAFATASSLFAVPASSATPLAAATEDAVQLARKTMMTDPARAYRIGMDLEKLAKNATDAQEHRIALARAYWISGEASTRLHRYGQARRLIDASHAIAVRSGNVKAQADALLSSGSLRHERGDMAGALGDYLGAMRLFQALGDSRSQAIALQYLGGIYMAAADYQRANRYYTEAAETYSSEPRMVLALQNNLGNLKMETGRYDEASAHFERASTMAGDLGDHALEAYILNNLVRSQVVRKRLGDASATVSRIRSLSTRHRLPLPDDMAVTLGSLALAQGRLDDARRYVQTALSLMKDEGGTTRTLELHDLAYRVFKARGEDDAALRHLEDVRRIRDSLSSIAISTKTTLMAAQFDYASQELRISRLKEADLRRDMADERAQASRQKMVFLGIGVALLGLMSGLCFIMVTLRRSRNHTREVNTALTKALAEVGKRQIAEQKATQRAEHDALTGLPNRRHLYDRLYEQMEGSRAPDEQCSVMLLDLDRFKPINDVHGHDVGDSVLIQVAERLRDIAESHSAKAIRLGGDEFMMVMTAPRGDDAPALVAMQIIDAISAPYEVGDKRLMIGTSIGISRNPHDGKTVDDLLRAADIAMYEAKNSGRRTFRFFDEEMVIKLQRREEMENDLRAAIRDDRIGTVFQPIYSYAADRITGFEALARWTHDTRGPVSPDEFIPIAEDADLIDDVTSSVVRQACRAAREWPDDVTVSINLSPVLLRDSWIVARIFGILSSEGLSPRRLIIEITENAVIDNIEHAREIIDAFRASGIRVALDDFGKGYSSLSHLRQLSFDHMKLDASFVRTLHEDDSLKIATAVAGLGSALGLPVTAEGVESEEDAEIIRRLGFSYAQGYHYGRPMPTEEARVAAWPSADTALPLALVGAA